MEVRHQSKLWVNGKIPVGVHPELGPVVEGSEDNYECYALGRLCFLRISRIPFFEARYEIVEIRA